MRDLDPSVSGLSVLRFSEFELNLKTGELCKAGAPISLPPQPFRILALLASHPGQLISREEIQEQVWGRDTFVDFDRGLNFAIMKVRAALSDDADTPRYVETLPRRGYRFIGPVERVAAGVSTEDRVRDAAVSRPMPTSLELAAEAAPQALGGVAPRSSRPSIGPRELAWAAGTLALGVVVIGVMVAPWRHWLLSRPSPKPIESLAVLPLENLSGDKEQEYFAEGMTDALITELGKIGALRVISRTSVMPYTAMRKPLGEIAGRLNVDAVVEGTVLRSGNRVRITAQLIRAATERHLWAESYEGDLSDILALQGKVARAIASEIRIRLTPQEEARFVRAGLVNPAAYEAYLKGRIFRRKNTEEDVTKGMEYFDQAIQLDPAHRLGWAELAGSYAVLGILGFRPPHEVYPKAREAARRSLELDETQAEAHTVLANVKKGYDWDWAAAEKEYVRAIELNPNYSTAHQEYANLLSILGRHREALAEAKKARELDPVSFSTNAFVGLTYFSRPW